MGPQMIALSTVQAADLYLVRLASAYPAGSVAAYSYAFLFIQVPLGLFGFGIAVVLFPTLSHYYNTGNLQAFRQTHALSFQVVLALTVPAALGLVLLGRHGVALVFERGAFDAEATSLVYSLLVPFSGLIVAQATLEMVVRGFHARYNTRGPMWGYLGWLGAILLTGTLFHRWYGLPGLGLANSFSYTLMLICLYWLYRQGYAALPERILARSLAGTVLATAGMALVVWLIVRLPYSNLTVVSASILIGGAVYLGLSVVLNRPMIRQFSLMFNRFPPQQVANT
jgi:putative peptidoglycan lipid II flippase